MNKFKKLIGRFGWFGFVRLFFYPATVLVTTPVRLFQTLWGCRILADGRWGEYLGFDADGALNSIYYWTLALDLYRYGRNGTSSHRGLGQFRLAQYWFHSLPSLYAYWRMGAIVPLLGMVGWWSGHLLWLHQLGMNTGWLVSVLWLALTSTTFYANTFSKQNYNALGWLFVPIGLYGLATGQWVLAVLAWLGASLTSFTVVFLTGILALVITFQTWSFIPILTVVPAGLKLLTHFWPFISEKGGNVTKSVGKTAKAIGLTQRNAKYRRTTSMRWRLTHWYYLVIYSQFIVAYWLIEQTCPLWVAAALIVWIVNSTIIRFSDRQHMEMLVLSVATAAVLTVSFHSWVLLASYWLLASPIPLLIGCPDHRDWRVVRRCKPYKISPVLKDLEEFLAPVPAGKRVLMCFDDPRGVYERIFDGYRRLLEPVLYAAACRRIHFMPDWWTVFELNYQGAPDFWGRKVEEALRQMEAWKADYVVVYQPAGTQLEKKWIRGGLKVLSHFSWSRYESSFDNVRPYSGPTPDWWLLRQSDSN